MTFKIGLAPDFQNARKSPILIFPLWIISGYRYISIITIVNEFRCVMETMCFSGIVCITFLRILFSK